MSIPKSTLDKIPNHLRDKATKVININPEGKSVKLISRYKANRLVGKMDKTLFSDSGMNTINVGQAIEEYHDQPETLSQLMDLMLQHETTVISLYRL